MLEIIIKALVFMGVLFVSVLIPFLFWLSCDKPEEDAEAWMAVLAVSYTLLSFIFATVVVVFLSMKGVI